MSEDSLHTVSANAVALMGNRWRLKPIADVLGFFKIPFRTNPRPSGNQMLTICYCSLPSVLNLVPDPILCIPSEEKWFKRFLSSINVEATSIERWLRLRVKLYGLVKIQFQVSKIYFFRGPLEEVVSFKGIPLVLRVKGTHVYLMSVDVASEIKQLVNNGLDLRSSLFFRLYSKLSITSLVPRWLGNKILGWVKPAVSSGRYFLHMSCLDGLRYFLLAAIAITSQRPIKTLRFCKSGFKYAAIITHDVDTKHGLEEGIDLLRSVERSFGARSAWNIPTGSYQIKPRILKALASESCEIGSHGHRHDGRLIFATKNEIVKELQESRKLLTWIIGSQVKGFRAPLLQHSRKILRAVEEAGFIYDSSVPAWEVYSRTKRKPHGICTVYPFNVSERLVELPVTLPQDHQLMYLGRLPAREILELWRTLREYIRSLGGLCNVIIHPDKDLFGCRSMMGYYEKFIEEITGDTNCWLTTPSEVAKWWILRNRIELTDEGKFALSSCGEMHDNNELEKTIELIEYKLYDFTFD